jgi:hypothetical protein
MSIRQCCVEVGKIAPNGLNGTQISLGVGQSIVEQIFDVLVVSGRAAVGFETRIDWLISTALSISRTPSLIWPISNRLPSARGAALRRRR